MPHLFASSPAENFATDRIARARRIFSAPRALVLWHLGSFDAPTVAVVWVLAFAWAERVRLPLWAPVLVALVTWSVYVADRLLDAVAGLRDSAPHRLRERHFFHWRHRRALLPPAIGAACTAAGIILALMPPLARERDSVLAAAAFAYFSGVHAARNAGPLRLRRSFSFPGKEFLVGALFTAGCALPAWHRHRTLAAPWSTAWAFWIPAAAFAALAWLNCACITRWESIDGPQCARVEREIGNRGSWPSTVFCAGVLLACGLLLLAAAGAAHPRAGALLAAGAAGALLLALLDRVRTRMTPLALRSAADLVLLTPLPLLILAWVRR